MRNLKAWIVASLAAAALMAVPLQAKPETDHKARLKIAQQLMKSDGVTRMQDQVLSMMNMQVTNMMVAKSPGKESEIRALMGEILEEMKSTKLGMNDKIAQIYAEHFTLDEMTQLLAFKRSPLGKKMEKKMPIIMQQSMVIGQQWGQQVAADVVRRFQEKAKERGLKL